MSDYSRTEAARRAGIGVEDLSALVDLRIVHPAVGDRFSPGDVRRAELVQSLNGTGISLDGLAAALQRGTVSLDFLDAIAEYARPGEVLVSQAVVDTFGTGAELGASFTQIGPIELKGVEGAVDLFAARRG